MTESQRQYDLNGWFEVKSNPLSKVGVYDYSGAQIGASAADVGKIFKVYRPAEELGADDTIDSFKLVPLIDNHTMLGEGFTSTDDRPPGGVIGDGVRFDGDTLYGNVKVYSKALAEKIKNGKTELSMGYRCRYDFTPGVWNGEAYDVVQRDLRGNHVALVDEGRMGPEVSILDQLTFAVDAKELEPAMDEELKKLLDAIMTRLDAIEAKAKPDEEPLADDAELTEEQKAAKATADAEAKAAKDAEVANPEDPPASMDAALKTIAALQGRITGLEARPAMDERAFVDITAKRTSLVDRLTKHVGTFDHATMTVDDIAAYGVKKLDIKGVAKGQEIVALDAYLQARPDPTKTTSVAQDNKPSALSQRVAAHGVGA